MASHHTRDKVTRGRVQFGNLSNGSVTPGLRIRGRGNKAAADLGVKIEDVDEAETALVDVRYDQQARDLIFKRAPVAAGVAGGLVLASVLGGNAPPLNYNAKADRDNTDATLDEQGYPLVGNVYPESRPVSLPVPTLYKGKLRDLPRVKDWSRYILNPNTYVMGDKLPRCPDGLCYVRLERPFALDGRSWASSYDEYVYTESTSELPLLVAARTARRDFKTLYVYFDQDCTLRNTRPSYKITVTSLKEGAARPRVRVESRTVLDDDRQALKLTLNRALDPLLETVTITIPAATIRTTKRPPYGNLTTTLDVEFSADAYSVIMAVNRNATQGFAYGDLALLASKALTITDETKAAYAVDCYEIIAPAGPNVPPHSHQTTGGGPRGGGPALLTSFLKGT